MKIGVIACSKKKGPSRASSRFLYRGDLFRKSLALSERLYGKTIILSALYGVVDPDQEIAPYEKTLNNMPKAERKAWARMVRAALPSGEYVYFTGLRYREFLPHGETPMLG